MSKYDALRRYLEVHTESEWHATFADVEKVLGFPLPRSARDYQAWWNNGSKGPQARAWLEAGWRLSGLDVAGERLVFSKDGTGAARERGKASQGRPARDNELLGVPYPWDETRDMVCSVKVKWLPVGRLALDSAGKLAFPRATSEPGLYSLRVRLNGKEHRYVGEADNLQRRFGHYRNPGKSQEANIRIAASLIELIRFGVEVGVSISEGAVVDLGSGPAPAELSSKVVRILLENASILHGDAENVENLNRAAMSPKELAAAEAAQTPAEPVAAET